MANRKQVAIVKLLLTTFRRQNTGTSLDLSGADLRGADLRWTNLTGANLRGTDLTGATGLTAFHLAQALNLEHAILDPGRYADAVAAGYKPAT